MINCFDNHILYESVDVWKLWKTTLLSFHSLLGHQMPLNRPFWVNTHDIPWIPIQNNIFYRNRFTSIGKWMKFKMFLRNYKYKIENTERKKDDDKFNEFIFLRTETTWIFFLRFILHFSIYSLKYKFMCWLGQYDCFLWLIYFIRLSFIIILGNSFFLLEILE